MFRLLQIGSCSSLWQRPEVPCLQMSTWCHSKREFCQAFHHVSCVGNKAKLHLVSPKLHDNYVCVHELLLYKCCVLQCTELTCGGSIYPHIDALKNSTGIKYVTAEDSCCGSPRVTVEKYCSRMRRPVSINPSSVVRQSINIFNPTSIRKVPVSSWWWYRKTAGCVGSCAEQSSTTSSNICDGHNTVVGILHIVQS